MVLYYNKDLFDAAGIPYPTEDWDFATFRETARKLTKKGQYGFSLVNWMPGWVMFLWNNGGDVLSPDGRRSQGYLDSAKNVEAFSLLRDMIVKDHSTPSLSEAAGMGVDPFANGQAAMTVSGHWALVGYKNAPMKNGKPAIDWKRLGVVALPHNVPTSQTVLYMAAYGIPRGAKNPDLAWKYIKMWTSRAVQEDYQTTGIAVCARKDVSGERAGGEAGPSGPEESQEAEFIDIVPTGRPPAGSWVEGYEIVEKVGTSAMQSILNGADIQATLTAAAKRIDREFAKSK
jgi:multiple sugar transport system substrate-binding protein